MNHLFDVYGLGQAVVDMSFYVEEEFLLKYDLRKQDSNIVDDDSFNEILKECICISRSSGGSVFNTLKILGLLNCRVAFTGKVSLNDEMSKYFIDDLKKHNIKLFYDKADIDKDPQTKICCLITPDKERTFAINGNLDKKLSISDINTEALQNSKLFLFSGYVFKENGAIKAIHEAIEIVKSAKNKTALSLSALFCVENHKKDFLSMIHNNKLDYLFGNKIEMEALFEGKLDDLKDTILTLSKEKNMTICITRGKDNTYIFDKGEFFEIEVYNVNRIVDTTGCGDSFVAGFLYGKLLNKPTKLCGKIGNYFASKSLQKLGVNIELTDIIDSLKEIILMM